jgi:hypothetical protein
VPFHLLSNWQYDWSHFSNKAAAGLCNQPYDPESRLTSTSVEDEESEFPDRKTVALRVIPDEGFLKKPPASTRSIPHQSLTLRR